LLKNLFANAHLFFKTGNVTGNFSGNAVITTQITICITYFFDKTKALHCVAKLRLHLTPLSLPVRTGLTGDRGQVAAPPGVPFFFFGLFVIFLYLFQHIVFKPNIPLVSDYDFC
jgi:hypothetical protein